MAEEKVIKDILRGHEVAHTTSTAAATLLFALFKPFSSTDLIIDSTFGWVAQSLHGLIDFLERIVGQGRVVFIRMDFH